jgi:hypothetical protein
MEDPAFVVLKEQIIPAVLQAELILLNAGAHKPMGIVHRFSDWRDSSPNCVECRETDGKPGDEHISSYGSNIFGTSWDYYSGNCSNWDNLCSGWDYRDSVQYQCTLVDSVPLVDSSYFSEFCTLSLGVSDRDSASIHLTMKLESDVDRAALASVRVSASSEFQLSGTARSYLGVLTSGELEATCEAGNVLFRKLDSSDSLEPCPYSGSIFIDISENLSPHSGNDSSTTISWKVSVQITSKDIQIGVRRGDTVWDYWDSKACSWHPAYLGVLGDLMHAIRLHDD